MISSKGHNINKIKKANKAWMSKGNLDLLAASDLAEVLPTFERLVQLVVSDAEQAKLRLAVSERASEDDEFCQKWNVDQMPKQLIGN